MKMNTRMSQLLAKFNVSLSAPTGSPGPIKREFATVGDSLLLKNEFEKTKGVNATAFPDSTAFECFVNHVHLPFDGTKQSLESCLKYAIELRDTLGEVGKGRQFIVIVSLSDDDCVVRFHQLRREAPWLAEDLDAYKEEAILALVAGEPEHPITTNSYIE
jgi:hypothetical protein